MRTWTIREALRAFDRCRGGRQDFKAEMELIHDRRNKRKGTSRARRKGRKSKMVDAREIIRRARAAMKARKK